MRKIPIFRHLPILAIALRLAAGGLPALASDHADPLVLNPLVPPKDREPHITDLHVFLDKDQNPELPEAKALIIDFCVFPSMAPLEPARDGDPDAATITLPLLPELQPPATRRYKLPKLNLAGYTYRISLDLHARLDFGNAGDLARYGGTVLEPESIVSEVTLEFQLNDDATVKSQAFTGLVKNPTEKIKVQTGIFDDPFIFPRFFRTNVIGMVVSIPLDCFPAGQRNFLIWGTASKDGKQIDHVGRSQRTQLPRFDYLNTLPPSEHVAAINRHHTKPSVLWDFGRTFASPLFARRPYDAAPDVMIFTRDKPTLFPNGRKLSDDVTALIKETGDTQLWETAFADDPRYPRATMNDGDFVTDAKTGKKTEVARKQFGKEFPYLAPPWTSDELKFYPRQFPAPGQPNLRNSTWRTLWLAEVAAIAVLVLLLFFTVRSNLIRWCLVLVAALTFFLLHAVYSANLPPMDPMAMAQPAKKLCRLALGGALIPVLTLGWFFALGSRHGAKVRPSEPFPQGSEGLTEEDRPPATDPFDDVKAAVFSDPYYGKAWGGPERRLLPIYRQTLSSILVGILPFGKRYAFLQAARRTLKSRADLRWGPDRKGFRRLLHPMGICLAGTWKIDAAPDSAAYTGYFAKGSEGRVIGRYSNGGSKPCGGNYRSLALTGKLYPPTGSGPQPPDAPAHFFTQEDLGSTYSESIREAVLTNSPPVSPWNRGKDIFFLLVNGLTLAMADEKNTERQLYEIAELGKPAETPTVCPRFMRLTVSQETPEVGGSGADFRDEILGIIYDRGNPEARRKLIFDIEVSDAGKKHKLGAEWLTGQHWTRIGSITFSDAAASYNGDFVIHFHHPPWREDRNVRSSVVRPDLRT